MAAAPLTRSASRTGIAATTIALVVAVIAGMLGIRPAAAAPLDVYTINDVSQAEGTGGTTTFTFTVSRTSGNGPGTVTFATTPGTAQAGTDYTTATGTLSFTSTIDTRQVNVTVTPDATDEPDETFNVVLTPTGAGETCQNLDCNGLGTIRDDDGPEIVIGNAANVTEGNTGEKDATFTVSLKKSSPDPVTVHYATSDGAATSADGDYDATSGDLTFTAGQTSKTVTVKVNGDTKDENDENFFVILSSPSGGTISDADGEATIVDDDAPPVVSIAPTASAAEQAGTLNAVVTLTPASAKTVTVHYATADGTATAPADYTAVAPADGVLTFLPGQTSKNAAVSLVNDVIDEPAETFTITLSSPSNASIDPTKTASTATITDNDPTPTIAINDASATEGTHPSATFTVTLSNPSSTDVTVDFATANATATAGEDYTAQSGTLTFTAGQTSKPITVPILNDTLDEAATETFDVNLTNPSSNASVGDAQGVGTITDNDGPPTVSIDDVTHNEGNTGTTAYVFTVSLSTASGNPVSVHWATSDSTATTADSDYAAASGTASFAAGETSKQVTVNVNGDATSEPDEAFHVDLSAPSGATIADGQGVGTITNDDPGPKISIDDVQVTEGSAGTTNAIFTVTLDAPSAQDITVPFSTVDGSAKAPADYTAATGSVTFTGGDQSEQIFITVKGDTVAEDDETFTVHLGAPTGAPATFAKQDGTGTIATDDGPAPTFSINDVAHNEGNSGTTTYTFTVTRSGTNLLSPSTVAYTTVNDTAAAPADFTAASGTLTFGATVTTMPVTVSVVGDTTFEPTEAFKVVLSNPTDASIADNTGVGTITNDDAQPAISIDDVTLGEGDSGTTAFTFTISLTNTSSTDVKVDVATALGTAQQADFTAINPATTITIPAGSTSATVTVDVIGDTSDEADETFLVNLSNPVGATIGDDQGTGTITDDDAAPDVSISSPTLPEGNSGTTNATFTVSLSAPSGRTVTVRATTANGTATVADGDYVAKTEDLTFLPGETSKSFVVTVNGDTKLEGDETFTASLSNGGNTGTLGAAGTATVTNDDATPTITIDDLSVTEGNAGTTDATFTLHLSNPSSSAVTVSAATADGTASSPDYTGFGATTVTFAAGSTSQTVTATVKGDVLDEADETFFVDLSSPSGATIADNQAKGTITDDDASPSLSIGDASTTEGDTVAVTLQFTVTMSEASAQQVTVDFATSDGTATAGSDYTATSGTVTFNPGETSKTIVVPVAGDTADEPNETLTVTLSNPTNAAIADGTATGTINDNDEPATAADIPQGYSLVGEDGSLYAFGTAKNLGDMRGARLNAPIIGVAYTPGGNGYWLVARDGGIFNFGDAEFFGSTGDMKLSAPVIGMAATPSGKGYWLFASDGGVFTFGDAAFFGSTGNMKLNAPIINMEPLASGNGYWLVAADGGIFTFGLGDFYGSMGDQKINQPVFDMTSTDSDHGYWLVARDGGIFSFGDAAPKFFGSAVNENPRPTRVIGMDSTPDSQGYWIADASGRIYNYGNAKQLGDRSGNNNPAPMVAFAAVPSLKQAA